eukprot:COSAG06_NODE_5652_length_3341_cov_2.227637_4_plen_47_part_00
MEVVLSTPVHTGRQTAGYTTANAAYVSNEISHSSCFSFLMRIAKTT